MDYRGKVCINSVGRVGVVTGSDPDSTGWCGFGLDGKGTWRTSNPKPHVLTDSLYEYRDLVVQKGGTGGHLYK